MSDRMIGGKHSLLTMSCFHLGCCIFVMMIDFGWSRVAAVGNPIR